MMKKQLLAIAATAMAAIAILASCSGDDIAQPDNNRTQQQSLAKSGIYMSGTDFSGTDFANTGIFARGTTTAQRTGGPKRTTLKPTDKALTFAWSDGDIVGVFSKTAQQQVPMYMKSGADTQEAQFRSDGFRLMPGEQYVAYYPIVDKVTASPVVPVSYLGQTQDGNNSYAHIPHYDYMVSDAVTPEAVNTASFKLHHMGCILRLRIAMPTADTYKTLTLNTGSTQHVFDTEVNLNLFDSPIIEPTLQSTDMTVILNNTATTEGNKTLTVWMMLSPIDLTGQPLTVTISSATQGVKDITCSYTPTKAYESGKAYSVDIDARTATYIDLGLPSGNLWATCNIGASVPEESGFYLAWGVDKLISSTRYSDYPCYYIYQPLGKYTSYKGNSSYDSARQILGNHWATPSQDDWMDLINNSDCEWTTLNNVSGLLVTGPNKKTLFLPAAGYYSPAAKSYKQQGTYGHYWSSEFKARYYGDESVAACLDFYNDINNMDLHDQSYWFGCSVRPIYVP